jgi:hypothetical protein
MNLHQFLFSFNAKLKQLDETIFFIPYEVSLVRKYTRRRVNHKNNWLKLVRVSVQIFMKLYIVMCPKVIKNSNKTTVLMHADYVL